MRASDIGKNRGWDNVIQKPLSERFEAKVSRDGTGGCWLWTGAVGPYGYGKIRNHYKTVGAHRVSYELNVGPIPAGMHVLHKCDNTLCVNPAHLFLGNQSDNMKDMFAKGRNKNQYTSGNSNVVNGMERPVEGLINGEWVRFRKMSDAAQYVGVSVSKVSMAARGLRRKAGNAQWRLAQ